MRRQAGSHASHSRLSESGIQIYQVIGIGAVEPRPAGIMIRREDSSHDPHRATDRVGRAALVHSNETVLVARDQMWSASRNGIEVVGDAGHHSLGGPLGGDPS